MFRVSIFCSQMQKMFPFVQNVLVLKLSNFPTFVLLKLSNFPTYFNFVHKFKNCPRLSKNTNWKNVPAFQNFFTNLHILCVINFCYKSKNCTFFQYLFVFFENCSEFLLKVFRVLCECSKKWKIFWYVGIFSTNRFRVECLTVGLISSGG